MRRVIVTLLICVFALGMNAQDMTSVFTAMPDQYIPQLEHAWRKDLVDLYTSGKESRLKNTMNGFSNLQKLTNDYLLLQNTYVVCMISTVNGPVPDSRIEFFTTNWEPLATSDLFTQPTSDWYIKQGIDKKDEAYQEAASHLDMDLIQYRLSPDDQTLTAIYTTPQYLSQEAREKIEPYLSEPKVYTWQKYHFQ